jgi:sugar phosphate isomerase/epimerase
MKIGAFVNIHESDQSNWERQFDFAETLPGLNHVEIWLEHLPSPEETEWTRDRLASLGAAALLHAPFVGIALASHDEEIRKAGVGRLIKAAHFGEAIGAEVMTCHSGQVGAWVSQEQGLDTLAGSLTEIVAATSVTVTIENMPARSGGSRELVTTAKDLVYLTRAVEGLGVTLDLGHSVQNREDPAQALDELEGVAKKHFHLHDGFHGGRAHLALGAGEFDWQPILRHPGIWSSTVSLETLGEDDTSASWQQLVIHRFVGEASESHA